MFLNTNSQMEITLTLIVLGFACGMLFNVSSAINEILHRKLWIKIILEFLSTMICGIIFYLSIQRMYFGWIRPYMICAFILGLYTEIISCGRFVHKFVMWTKAMVGKIYTKFKFTKVGSKITK